MKRWSQIKKWQISLPLMTTTSMVLAACSSNNQYANEIIFSLAQNKYYPMAITMKKLIPLYNEQQKNVPGFMPVKGLYAEDLKIGSESGLLNDTVTKISVNDPSLPSLILNSNTAASTINAYSRLLDVSDVLNASDIAPDLLPLYQTVTGLTSESHQRLYALPFNLSTTESVAVNVPVLRWMLDLAKSAGATVTGLTDSTPTTGTGMNGHTGTGASGGGSGSHTSSESTRLVTSSLMTSTTTTSPNDLSVDKIIEDVNKMSKSKAEEKIKNTLWANYELDDSKKSTMSGYTINDETFVSWDKISEFGQKIAGILKLKSGHDHDKAPEEYANVVSVDYAANVFFRRLWEATGAKQSSYVYQYKTTSDTTKNIKQVDYLLLTDSSEQNKFKTAYDQFQAHYELPNKTNKVKAIYYTDTKTKWASWLLRQFKTAVAIAPNVGVRQSVQSQLSKLFFASGSKDEKVNEKTFNSFGVLDTDVKWYHQLMRTQSPTKNSVASNPSSMTNGGTSARRASSESVTPTTTPHQQLQTYIGGGSSLIPISINPKKDAALKLFLTWLYKGHVNVPAADPASKDAKADSTKSIPTIDLVEETSGYFVPLAEHYKDMDSVKKRIQWYDSEIKKHENDDTKFLLTSLKLSAEDYERFLAAKKTAPYASANAMNNGKSDHGNVLFNPAGDINTAALNSTIFGAFQKMGEDGATQKTTDSELLTLLKNTPLAK